jgi:hypothetical protein
LWLTCSHENEGDAELKTIEVLVGEEIEDLECKGNNWKEKMRNEFWT